MAPAPAPASSDVATGCHELASQAAAGMPTGTGQLNCSRSRNRSAHSRRTQRADGLTTWVSVIFFHQGVSSIGSGCVSGDSPDGSSGDRREDDVPNGLAAEAADVVGPKGFTAALPAGGWAGQARLAGARQGRG